jgi:CTP-dependent riboflavin kinase
MATAAAAVVAKARREVISHLMQNNAVSASSAVRWIPDRRLQRRVLERLVRRGVIVETADDTYYLDVPEYDRWRRSVRLWVTGAVGTVLAIGAAAALLA